VVSAHVPEPPPIVSPDGGYRWDGYQWILARSPVPWRVRVAEVLLFVEAGFVWVIGGLLILGFGAIGVLVNSDNGGSGLPAVGRFLLLMFLATLVVAGLLVSIGILMVRRRWARWVMAVFQMLFVAYAVGSAIYYFAAVPGHRVEPAQLQGLMFLAVPLLIVTLLLHPASRRGSGPGVPGPQPVFSAPSSKSASGVPNAGSPSA
jgi:hypothetical protein